MDAGMTDDDKRTQRGFYRTEVQAPATSGEEPFRIEWVSRRAPIPENEPTPVVGWVRTRNRDYGVSADRVCVEVRDRGGALPYASHRALGKRLAGGFAKEDDEIVLSTPWPAPSSLAVFEPLAGETDRRVVTTSRVHEVVIQQRVVRCHATHELPKWVNRAQSET